MKIKKTAVKIVLNKKAFILAFLVLSVIIIIAGYFMYKNSSSKSNKICIEGKTCFYAEIADTLGERERGLSGKQSLGDDKGMLFTLDSKRFKSKIISHTWGTIVQRENTRLKLAMPGFDSQ